MSLLRWRFPIFFFFLYILGQQIEIKKAGIEYNKMRNVSVKIHLESQQIEKL